MAVYLYSVYSGRCILIGRCLEVKEGSGIQQIWQHKMSRNSTKEKEGKCVGEKPRKTTIYSIMMVSCHFFAPKMAHTFSMYRKLSQRKINKKPIKSPSDPPNFATKVNTGYINSSVSTLVMLDTAHMEKM